jgi:hypothetical protein
VLTAKQIPRGSFRNTREPEKAIKNYLAVHNGQSIIGPPAGSETAEPRLTGMVTSPGTGRSIRRLTIILSLLAGVAAPQPPSAPELPDAYVDIPEVTSTGPTITVAAGGDLQAALNRARPGDVIALEAGATFTGNFTLPNREGVGWVTVRSSAMGSGWPRSNARVTPVDAARMPKLVSPNLAPALQTDLGAHHYRFIGIEITTTHSSTTSTHANLILMGYSLSGRPARIPSELPSDIIFDRCYIHGNPRGNIRRGIALNGIRVAVVDSYLSDFHEVGADTQAINGWSGAGPFKIVGNYLEAAGENVMFGGAIPAITNLVPSDIEIRDNHFFKPLSWKLDDPSYGGVPWTVKNLFELKNTRRVLVDGNLLENNWAAAQQGYAVVLTPRKEDCNAPWAVVEDVTFTNNVVRRTASGINFLGIDDSCPSAGVAARRFLIKNNLFEDFGGVRWGGAGNLFQILRNTVDVVIDHNTALHPGAIIVGEGEPSPGLVFRNNVAQVNAYGVVGTAKGVGNGALGFYFPDVRFEKNVLVGPWPTSGGATTSMYSNYPNNFFAGSIASVGFVDPARGDHRLGDSSPYKRAGTDGRDIGADFERLHRALSAVGKASP